MALGRNNFQFSALAPTYRQNTPVYTDNPPMGVSYNSKTGVTTNIGEQNDVLVDPNPIVVTGNQDLEDMKSQTVVPQMMEYLNAGSTVNPTSSAKMPTSALSEGLGFNMGTAQLALGGLQTIGNLWGAFQANKMAKKQFKYTKEVTDTNLNNSIKSYNTALSDRINSRAVVNGLTQDQVNSYLSSNSLARGNNTTATRPTVNPGG